MDTPDPLKLVPTRADRPGRRKGDDAKPWQQIAPRWSLILAITGLVFTVGWQSARLEGQATLQAAFADANAKAQARLAERVAVTEEQQRQSEERQKRTEGNIDRMVVRMDKRDEAISELTTSLRLLTAELKRAESRR